MLTRCPSCKTTFRVTSAQLRVRDGKVRCGRCQSVFQADEHLVNQPSRPAKGAGRKRAEGKPAVPPVVPDAQAEPTAKPELVGMAMGRHPIPLADERLWILGSVVLVVAALIQAIVFYGQTIGRTAPWARSGVITVCEFLPCRQLPPIDLRRIDLSETRVTPHPRYDRVLHVKATVVNRADYPQPYPLLEVSLMDSQGLLVARRAYPPRDYLAKPESIASGLPPHVAVHIALDITSPGSRASGYEVLLLPPVE